MADKKITELTNITGVNLANTDEFVVVDVSADETKAVTRAEFFKNTPSINVTGTVTADGLTVDGDTVTANAQNAVTMEFNGATGIISADRTGGNYANLSLRTTAGSTPLERLHIAFNGDINFYESLGITPKFHWDASAESLGIGSSSPSGKLEVNTGSGAAYFTRTAGDNGVVNPALGLATTSSGTRFGSSGPLEFRVGAVGTAAIAQSEAMRIDSSGNVGIGTAVPAYALDVSDVGESWIRTNSSTSTNDTGLRFSHAGVNHFVIGHSGVTDSLAFYDNIAVAERMRIDASGAMLLGTTTAGSAGAGDIQLTGSIRQQYFNTNTTKIIGVEDATANAFVLTNRGNLQVQASSAIGSANAMGGGNLTLKAGDSFANGAGADGNVILKAGTNTGVGANVGYVATYTGGAERMRIDSSGHAIIPAGVTLGTAAGVYSAANTLDDYEEGTWTPTDASGAGLSLTIGAASYTKIGRLCYIYAFILYPSNASGFTHNTGGLPFTSIGGSNYAQLTVRVTSNTVSASNLTFQVETGGDYGTIHMGYGALTNAMLSSNSILISGVYETA